MRAFKAYDIRGIYPEEINEDMVYQVGYHLRKVLQADNILVGRDIRLSSDSLFKALSKGITDSGADCYDAGVCTTPMVYFGTARFNMDASVQITASHNAKEYNGLKVSGPEASPVGYDNGLNEIENRMGQAIQAKENKGEIIPLNIKNAYYQFMKAYLPDVSDMHVCIDCSNGVAGLFIRDLLGEQVHYINETPDGNFPDHDPNPLKPENLISLRKAVLDNSSDLGIIFDGDADRVMFLDENGSFISPDLMIAVLGEYYRNKLKNGAKVIQDIRSSKSVAEYLEPMGANMYTWRVGRAFAARKLREIGGLFGGELAGHYYFKDFYYSDSGILACLLILQVISKFKTQGISLSELIGEINNYHSSGEINFEIKDKKAAMEAVKSHFTEQNPPDSVMDFDGYRLNYPDWWFNIRPSNTEPYLRVILESKNKEILDEKLAELKQIILQY